MYDESLSRSLYLSALHTTAAERTDAECRKLVNAAGLKKVKIWKQPMALDGVIEVDLA